MFKIEFKRPCNESLQRAHFTIPTQERYCNKCCQHVLVSSSKLWDPKKLQARQNLKEFLVSCPKLYHLSKTTAGPAVTWASSISTLSCSPCRLWCGLSSFKQPLCWSSTTESYSKHRGPGNLLSKDRGAEHSTSAFSASPITKPPTLFSHSSVFLSLILSLLMWQ